MLKKLFALTSSTLVLLGLPRPLPAQNPPLTIDTTGLTCTNSVCDLGTGNVGTFLKRAWAV